MQDKYNGWGFYNDRNDPRLIVPKMNPAFGWTLNVGHPKAGLVVILSAAALAIGPVLAVLLG